MQQGPEALYNQSVARIVTNRTFAELDAESRAYWEWKFQMLARAREREESRVLEGTPAPVVPLFRGSISHLRPVTSAPPVPDVHVMAKFVFVVLVVLLLLGAML